MGYETVRGNVAIQQYNSHGILTKIQAHPKFDQPLIANKKRIMEANPAEYGGPFNVFLYNSTAIGWKEGEIEFYLDTRSSVTWGSSLIKGKYLFYINS